MKFRSVRPAEEWFCNCTLRTDKGATWFELRSSEQPHCNECGCIAPWAEIDDDITSVRAEPIE